jgi:hypothetical protein
MSNSLVIRVKPTRCTDFSNLFWNETGVGLTTPHSKKLIVTKVEKRKKLDGFNDDGESW